MFGSFDVVSAETDEEFIAELVKQYKVLDAAIRDHESEPLANFLGQAGSSAKYPRRGRADAVLFGHIAEALCHEKLSVVIQEYHSLMAFFRNVCNVFFSTPYNTLSADKDDLCWTVSDVF